MSTRDLVRALAALVLAGCASGNAPVARVAEPPKLGREATPAQIAGWDISVGPDGVGLPEGRGTAATGATVYEQKCQACHGAKGAGQPNDRLVGGQGTLASKTPVRTIGSYWPYATTVFDYVRRAMPYTQPQSLSADETYAVTAYLLNLNGIIGDQDEMNARTLPKVKMPNQASFLLMYPARGGRRP
jgi:mono/diheme cytochrome c family protein